MDKRIHFKPFNDNSNVKCLNGSIHVRRTTDATKVTCEACLKNDTDNFWDTHEKKKGNRHKNCHKGLRPYLKSTFKKFIKKLS